jgi:hypothetical protein
MYRSNPLAATIQKAPRKVIAEAFDLAAIRLLCEHNGEIRRDR